MSEDEVWAFMDVPERRSEFASRILEGAFDVDYDRYTNRHFPGQTILRLAVVIGAEDVALELLAKGADPRIAVPNEVPADVPSETAFSRAFDGGGLVKFVAACLDKYPSLIDAPVLTGRPIQRAVQCRPPNLELVQLLVDRGAELNFRIDKKYTFERYMKELWKPQYSRMDVYEPILRILGYRD